MLEPECCPQRTRSASAFFGKRHSLCEAVSPSPYRRRLIAQQTPLSSRVANHGQEAVIQHQRRTVEQSACPHPTAKQRHVRKQQRALVFDRDGFIAKVSGLHFRQIGFLVIYRRVRMRVNQLVVQNLAIRRCPPASSPRSGAAPSLQSHVPSECSMPVIEGTNRPNAVSGRLDRRRRTAA